MRRPETRTFAKLLSRPAVSDSASPTFEADFRDLRDARGLSLEDLNQETRVPIDVLRRFERSAENLPRAIAKADSATLYDSSGRAYTRTVAELDRDGFAIKDGAPAWAKEAAGDAARIWRAEAVTVKDETAAMMREAEADHAQGSITAEELDELREFQTSRDSQADRDGPGGIRE